MSQNVAKLIEDLTEDMGVYMVNYEMGETGFGVSLVDSEVFLAYTLQHAIKAAESLIAEFAKDNHCDFWNIVGVERLSEGPIWVRTDGDDWSDMLNGALEIYQDNQISIEPVAI